METQVIEPIFSFDRYPIELKKQEGMFYLLCQTLGIVECDADIEKAYEKLNTKRKAVIRELSIFGINPENGVRKYSSNRNTMFVRLVKYIVITTLLFIPIGLIAGYTFVTNKITTVIANAQNGVKQRISTVLNDPSNIAVILSKAADTLDNVTPERKEELQLTLRRLTTSLKPFADEIKPLYLADK